MTMQSSFNDAGLRDFVFLKKSIGHAFQKLGDLERSLPTENIGGAIARLNDIVQEHVDHIASGVSVAVAFFSLEGLDEASSIETIRLSFSESRFLLEVNPGLFSAGLGIVHVSNRLLGPVTMFVTSCHDNAISTCHLCQLSDIATGSCLGFCSNDPRCFLLPDSDFFSEYGYQNFREHMKANKIAWSDKKSELLWRGSSTGIPSASFSGIPDQDVAILPRVQLCHKLVNGRHSSISNALISGIVQITDPRMLTFVENLGITGGRLDKLEFRRSKFIIDIDGNSNAWSGLLTGLLSASCVIKVQSRHGFRQWYYGELIPWVHYIPVKADLSDLEETIDWLITHDYIAQQIAASGAAFAEALSFDRAFSDTATQLAGLITVC